MASAKIQAKGRESSYWGRDCDLELRSLRLTKNSAPDINVMKVSNTPRFDCIDISSSWKRHACRRCGNCCRGNGRVRLVEGEIDRIATYFGMPVHEAASLYARLAEDRASLILTDNSEGNCTFLDSSGECRIHDVKPAQCRAYPATWRNPGETTECAGGVSFERTERER